MSVVTPLIGPPLYGRSFASIAAELGLRTPKRKAHETENVGLRVPAQRRPATEPLRADR